jgi:hypothetical protein
MSELQSERNPYAPPQSKTDAGGKQKLLPHQKAARVMRLLAILGVVGVIGITSAVLLPTLSSGRSLEPIMLAIPCLGVAWVVGLFFVAGAIKSYKAWGRYIGIVYALVALTSIPIGTLIGG